MVPFRQGCRILWAVADEHTQIVHPRCGIEHIVIKGPAFHQFDRQLVQSRLMTEFIRGIGLSADEIRNGGSVFGLLHPQELTSFGA